MPVKVGEESVEEMDKEQFLQFIESEEGKTLVSESGLTKLTNESVENYLTNTDEGKKILFSQNDKAYNKRFEKFKSEGGLAKLVEEEYQKRHPDLTEDQKKLRATELELETLKRNAQKQLNIKELKELNSQYGLSDDILELVITDNAEESKKALETIGGRFKAHMDSIIQAKVDEALKATPKPLGGKAPEGKITYKQYLGMSEKERKSLTDAQLKDILKS